ncbi:phosphonate ABC transporter, permease protein PhnE [Asticcacaulis endophyticus]|uniref:Phosphonate ABC transporter, permease protein PhnE n=1 Tax=Asticcacaulis endophyticus TaxID=1395890 RepID=A0A918PRJ9_9CAUL|nr:phosphonate ABC transporter, permease protein PhnE [Asticcacaulis endophyticus]GGZ20745.1 phosphonate ABC transporter, permease protein PhnE [Asticcacaulis endophyticus]
MSKTAASDISHLAPPTTSFMSRLITYGGWAVLIFVLAISFKAVEMDNLPKLFTNSANTQTLLKEYMHPDFSDWRNYVDKMWLTIQIAIWGTVASVIMAVPFSLLCASNIAPQWIVQIARRLMDILRSVNELVLATLFLVAVGPGALAGVLALSLHNAGVLAKLFSEAVEAIDKAPVEGVRATGGNRLHEIVWGVFPQVAPLWTSFALYRFESSARSATVLGLIGAGGIGAVLFDNLQSFDYANTSAIAIIIIIAVTGIDFLSQAIRKHLL